MRLNALWQHLPFVSLFHRRSDRPRSLWGTLLSVLTHVVVILALWSAPAVTINPPDVPPPQSIDATILPPPPSEKVVSKTVEPPKNAEPSPPHNDTPIASNKPAPSSSSAKLPNADNGTAASGSGDKNSKSTVGNGSAKKALPSGTPVAVEPSGGFVVRYQLDASGGNNASASGGATLVFNRKGDRYSASLNANASILFLKGSIIGRSEGQVRKDTLATDSFANNINLSIGKDQAYSFKTDYAGGKVVFTNNSNTVEHDLTHDVLFDYVSVLAYLQAGFQQGALRAGQGSISLPIGKKQDVEQARIAIGDEERISTYVNAGDAIPVNIAINSGSIKFIKVWFVPDKKYLPLKMEIGVEDKKITLLANSTS